MIPVLTFTAYTIEYRLSCRYQVVGAFAGSEDYLEFDGNYYPIERRHFRSRSGAGAFCVSVELELKEECLLAIFPLLREQIRQSTILKIYKLDLNNEFVNTLELSGITFEFASIILEEIFLLPHTSDGKETIGILKAESGEEVSVRYWDNVYQDGKMRILTLRCDAQQESAFFKILASAGPRTLYQIDQPAK